MTEPKVDAPHQNTESDAGGGDGGGAAQCWCCGHRYAQQQLVHLGGRPEVTVCLTCAHFLHQQARQREDTLRSSIAGGLRDSARWGRRLVIERGWHLRPLIGRPLRWLGRRLP